MSTSTAETAAPTKPSILRWIRSTLNSSIGAKQIVAVTGLILVGFVLGHMLGNAQILVGLFDRELARDLLNSYAEHLKALGPLLWVARVGLLIALIVHLSLALRLFVRNREARPVPYHYERSLVATTPSRYMWLTGLVLLAFIIFHLAHYSFGWIGSAPPAVEGTPGGTNLRALVEVKDGKPRHDVYQMVIYGFQNIPVAVSYIIAQLLLGAHLIHGTRSMFQTLGINFKKRNPLTQAIADTITVAVVGVNVLMPLAVMFRLIN
jgi:succinate dehydrogenase / fumarate reductase cytochrome b subunit